MNHNQEYGPEDYKQAKRLAKQHMQKYPTPGYKPNVTKIARGIARVREQVRALMNSSKTTALR